MFEHLNAMLKSANARFRVVRHPAEGNSERVAAVRGTQVSQGAKAMLCRVKSQPESFVLAIVPGDRRIDFNKLSQLSDNKKVSLSSPDDAVALTGCVIGAIPPFSFSPDIRLVVDPRLLAHHEEIAFNAGRLDTSIVLNAADYQRIAAPLLADICADA